MPKTILIVPCFNEEERLDRAEFLRLAAARPDLELLFVDDGSTDRTADVVESLRAAQPQIDLLRLDRNRGKAEAVRLGMREALRRGGVAVGFLDADLATPVDEILRLVRVMDEQGASVVLGSRVRLLGTRIERHAHRHYVGRVFATLASLTLRVHVYDTQCGAKLFQCGEALAAALEEPFGSRWAFDVVLLERLLGGSGAAPPLPPARFVEVPLSTWRDTGGSKLGFGAMLRAGLELLGMLLRSRFRRPPSFTRSASSPATAPARRPRPPR